MSLIKFFEEFLEGRGFYPSLLVIVSWTYTIIFLIVIVCQFFLYIFRVKYCNPEFNHSINKKLDTKESKDE